jgi:hypothetical protein
VLKQLSTMIKHLNSYLIAGVLALAALSGCQKDKELQHASGEPMSIAEFTPTIGGWATEILITGNNFSSDTAEISVTINGNPCAIVNSNTKQIMAVVPKRCGSGKVVVKIGKDSIISSTDFNYIFTSRVTTFAGNGKAGFANGMGADAQFNFSQEAWYRSMGIAADDNGNVYIADPGNHCVRKIDSTGMVSVLAGDPANAGYGDGRGAAAKFNLPYGLAVDKAGNVYTADPVNWDLRKIAPDGTATTVGWGAGAPWGITVDNRNGDIYYTATDAGKVIRLREGGNTDVITGLSYPAGIVCDASGNLFVACNGTSTIVMAKADTYDVSVIAGQSGITGYENGVGTAAKFAYPWGLGIDTNGNIYVAGNGTAGGDATSGDQSIRMIEANTWLVRTLAGSSSSGYNEGVGEAASFAAPTGVGVDKNGVAYVIDKMNNVVRKIVTE